MPFSIPIILTLDIIISPFSSLAYIQNWYPLESTNAHSPSIDPVNFTGIFTSTNSPILYLYLPFILSCAIGLNTPAKPPL